MMNVGGTGRWATNNDDNIIALALPAPPTQQSNYEVTLRRGQDHAKDTTKMMGRREEKIT